MIDWLDGFQMMGATLNEGEKSLMRFAMKKERDRIIKLLEELAYIDEDGHEMIGEFKSDLMALIKGEQK